MTTNDSISLKELIQSVAEERGLDLSGYKPSTLDRRVRKRMFEIGVGSYSAYLEKVRQDPAEVNQLLNTVLINITEFFRDPQAWDCLRNEILPSMLRRMKEGDSFRAWSAGCASGEEPYSLAILLADYFGARVGQFDIKIYATDNDEDALNAARRGEYRADRLQKISQSWREQYFDGESHLRVNRDIRRMVIFGRSNLVKDAPISHCNLVICRNVLIYFDAAAQKQVLARLQYALDPGGVLFLGKAESKLGDFKAFNSLNPRWRIFQRVGADGKATGVEKPQGNAMSNGDQRDTQRHEMNKLQIEYQHLLETLRAGVVILDARDVITSCNERALAVFGLTGARVAGKRLQNTDIVFRCPELVSRLEASRATGEAVTFEARERTGNDEHIVCVIIRPIVAEKGGERTGTIIYTEDVTSQGKLQVAVEQLEATSEELQAANEELQSTNEELETTNEELQSTNEELQTTNEELQALNEELENMNEELETRTRELNALSGRYAETLRQMPWPVMLVDREEKIQLWNAAAQKIFGVGASSVVGVALEQFPMEVELRKTLVRRCRAVLLNGKPSTIRDFKFNEHKRAYDIQFTPVSREETLVDGVVVMFGPFQQESAPARAKKGVKRGKVEATKNVPAASKAAKTKQAKTGR
jgi:two-component system, chemotaxis family, CheB/CheR fusion protein